MNFEVIRQTIRRTDSAPIIADSINYLTAKFRFSSDWADLEKHVTFTLGTNVYDKTLDADDEIKADQGLNLTEGIWTIGIVGVEVVEGEMVERITADTVTVLVTMAGALGGEAFPEMSGAFGEIILQSEADRVAAEAARVAAEEEREAYYAAAQTGFDEEARVTAENLRVEAENARAIAEATRENWYQDAQTGFDEAARVAAENLRIEAENARDIAEGLRDSSEQERVSAEGLRVTAEQGRDTAEGLRVTAESGRDSAEGIRTTAEESRVAAEGLRDSAEQARDSAEDDRVAAESARAFYAAYNGTTSYILGNKVSYNGSSYIWNSSTPSTAGTQPPTSNWLLIASRGDDGLDGVSGVYVGSDPIPEGYNVQIDPDGDATDVVLQFGTMPTPDADYLGVAALYTGTTGTYKNGGTYICVSSGGATPVYSWSRVGEDVSGAISTHNTDAGAHAALIDAIDDINEYGYNLKNGLLAYRLALADVGRNPIKIAAIGTSITFGKWASDVTLTSWSGRIRTAMQNKYGNVGRGNYVPGVDAGEQSVHTWWTFSGAWSFNSNYGIGGKGFYGQGNDKVATLVFTGTSIDLIYQKASNGSVNGVTVTIDGASQTPPDFSGSAAPGQVKSYTGLADGAHIMVITADAAAGKYCYIEGAIAYNPILSGDRGCYLFEYGCPSGTASYFTAGSSRLVPATGAKLVIIELGTNDTADTASFYTNMQTIISNIKANARTSVLLLTPYHFYGVNTANLDIINGMLYTLADTYNCALIDMDKRFAESYSAMDALGVWGSGSYNGNEGHDGVHPSDKGHRFMADTILSVIL